MLYCTAPGQKQVTVKTKKFPVRKFNKYIKLNKKIFNKIH